MEKANSSFILECSEGSGLSKTKKVIILKAKKKKAAIDEADKILNTLKGFLPPRPIHGRLLGGKINHLIHEWRLPAQI